MASYLPGVQDYIPQFQPFSPDYNFLGNMLQNAQSKYDQNYKQISKTYGTLLNSPMLRADNIQQRDEFFKMIDGDIKRISGLDLSLQQNVDSANAVFDSFYKNKDLVKDMVYTKEYQNQIQTGENFRNCLDQDKCGGYYSEDAMKALNYKADEFKNASREEARNMSPGRFTPFINVHEKAVKLAKEAGLNVTQDVDTGKWIVKRKNGELVQGGLYSLFSNTIGSDPKVKDMYNTAAYVKRKDYAKGFADQFGSEEQAELHYINTMLSLGDKEVTQQQKTVSDASDQMSARQAELLDKEKSIGLTDEEQDALLEIQATLPEISNAQNNLATTKSAINNNTGENINALRARSDAAVSHLLSQDDFVAAAKTLSLKDMEQTMTANPYSLASHSSALALGNQKTMARINQENALERMRVKADLDMDLKQFEYNLETGAAPGLPNSGPGTPISIDNAEYATATDEIGATFKKNQVLLEGKQLSTSQQQLGFLKDFYKVAKEAKTPGATQILEQVFGKDLNANNLSEKIKQNPDLINNMYDKVINTLDVKCTTCDHKWATQLLDEYETKGVLDNINNDRQAVVALTKKVSRINEGVIKNIQKQQANAPEVDSFNDLLKAKTKDELEDIIAGNYNKNVEARRENRLPIDIYKDADLLLTKGYLDEEGFKKKFIEKHSRNPEYQQALNNVQGNSFLMGALQAGLEDSASEAFELLSEKFHHEYIRNKEANITTGYNLSGTGTIHSDPLLYSSVDAAKFQSGPMIQAAQDFQTFFVNKDNITFGLGDPSAVNKGNLDPAIGKLILANLTRDLNTRYTKNDNDRPIFSYLMSPVAANESTTGARTIILNPEYLKKLVGTKAVPGILAGTDITDYNNGFTIFYNKEDIKLGADEMSKDDNLDIVASYGNGVKFNVKNGGNTTITKDQETGNYDILGNIIYYKDGVKVTEPYVQHFTGNTILATPYQEIQNMLINFKKANNLVESEIALRNSQGYKMPGMYPPKNQNSSK